MYFDRPVPYTLLLSCLLMVAGIGLSNFQFGSLSERARSLSVTTEYFGANAREIERVITIPIEDSVADVPGIKSIASSSEFGKSRVVLVAKDGVEMRVFSSDVKERVDRARAAFPHAVQKTRIASSDSTNTPVYIVAFQSSAMGQAELGEYVENEVKKTFERVRGTGDIVIAGRGVEDVMVTIDPARASRYDIDAFAVSDALQTGYARVPVGAIRVPDAETALFFDSELNEVDDFGELTVRASGGKPVKLSKIASIARQRRFVEERSRIDGEERVILYVHDGGTVNELALCDELRKTTDGIATKGLEAEVIYDKGTEIMGGIRSILISTTISMISLFLFIGAFMSDLRSRIVLSVSIPFSLFLGLSFLSLAGVPVNASVISGLTIGSGLIIDNYLIIHDYLRFDYRRSIKPIAMPLLAGTLTTLIVFLPLLALKSLNAGIVSISLSLCGMLMLSQLITFTFLPLPLRISCKAELSHRPLLDLRAISRPFFAITEFSLRAKRPLRFIYLAIMLIVPALLLFGAKEFTPIDDEGILFARVEFPSGTTIGETDTGILPYVREFKSVTGVKRVESNAKRGNADISVTFDKGIIGSEELKDRLERIAERSPKGRFFFGLDQNTKDYKIRFTLTGPDHFALREKAGMIGAAFTKERWVRAVIYHFKENPPSRSFVPDARKLAERGLFADRIASTLRWNVQGPVALKWIDKGKERDVRISSTATSLSLDDLGTIPIPIAESEPLTFADIGTFQDKAEPERLYRDNRQNSISFTVITDRIGLDEIDRRTRATTGSIVLAPGYGLFPDTSILDAIRDYRSMFLVFLLAAFLIYALLAVENESFSLPILIISAIPFSAFFPLAFLFAIHKPITIASIIGVIILSGTSVNNYILITDSLESSKDGETFAERVVVALSKRFNPLFLSSGTSVIASVPILFSGRPFSDFPNALAIIMTLGILGSFLGSFLFLPAIVDLFMKKESDTKKPRSMSGPKR